MKTLAQLFNPLELPPQGRDMSDQLPPLLEALKWKGEARSILEAQPAGVTRLDLCALRDTLSHLGFSSVVRAATVKEIDPRWLPALYLEPNGTPHLLTDAASLQNAPTGQGDIVLFYPIAESLEGLSDWAWCSQWLRRFKAPLRQVTALSMLIGALALASTFYNMAIYDQIIASDSVKHLDVMMLGVLTALVAETVLRWLRVKRLSHFGARLDHLVIGSVFHRLLYLPPLYTERASVASQLARLRDFESIREFFTGPLAVLFFELPLIGLYLAAMAIVGGWLALVPVALLVLYGILIMLMHTRIQERSRIAARTGSERQELLVETIGKMRAIQLCGMEDVWQERYREVSGKASVASFRVAFNAQVLETLSYVLMTLGAMATLGLGIHAIASQALTVGGLVASMMIVWRIIAPMQTCCASITRMQQLVSSSRQVKRLLSLAPEHTPLATANPLPRLRGKIDFHRVSLRYSPEAELALIGVNATIQPGQLVAIKGGNGSGKSTLLKLVLNMYQPQSGSVRIDDHDIRQFDPVLLRQQIGYVSQSLDLFPGTIRDNLLLTDPAASEQDCIDALKAASAWHEIEQLPQGLDTVVADEEGLSIAFVLKQRINLARAYLRRTPILLLDETAHSMGKEDDEAFASLLASLRGKTTILLVTHREDHMKMADLLLVLERGELTYAGPPKQVLASLKGPTT